MRPLSVATLSALAALAFAASAQAAAPEKDPQHRNCFLTTNWQGWSAPGNGDVIYLRVGLNDVYRLDLTPGSRVRRDPDRFLVNQVRGSSWICSAIDFDLTLSDHNGFREPIFVKSMRKLSPQEVAAIPKKDRPY